MTADADTDAAIEGVHALEQARLRALADHDIDAIAALMDDALVHVHATGQVDDREAFLQGLRAVPRRTERLSLDIRLLAPDVALLSGRVLNVVFRPGSSAPDHVPMVVTQVAVRREGRWRFVSFHACRGGG